MSAPEDVLNCQDCNGRRTILERATWYDKILVHHGAAMAQNQYAVEQTICRPDFINRDTDYDDRDVYYRRGVLPQPYHTDYLKVVVVIERTRTFRTFGRIISAYPTPDVKRGEQRIWPTKKRTQRI